MSSIAYVTDSEMLEYHRLCRNRTIIFWRLANKKKFADFRKGDLLFFFSRPNHGRKKGLVGYAHYDSVKRLSLNQLWDQYSEACGYETKQRLEEAIRKAGKGEIPKTMRCLYLTDVVFFISPVYPDEINSLDLTDHLESYTYLDRSDPSVTVKILTAAQKHGIDLWSADPDKNPDEIFRDDVVRHQIALISKKIGKESGSEKERALSHKLAELKMKENKWEMIRGSNSECLYMDKSKIKIAIPLVYQANDKDLRIREVIGKVAMYRYYIKKLKFERRIVFELMASKDKEIPEVEKMVEDINNG